MADNSVDNSVDANSNDSGKVESVKVDEEKTEFKIHNVLLNFFNNRLKDLVNIYLANLEKLGDGVMLLTLKQNEDKVDMSYIPIQYIPNPMDEDIKSRYRKNNYNRNIIYFVLASPEAENIIEIDLVQTGASLLGGGGGSV